MPAKRGDTRGSGSTVFRVLSFMRAHIVTQVDAICKSNAKAHGFQSVGFDARTNVSSSLRLSVSSFSAAHTIDLRFLSGRTLTTLCAGLALNIVSWPVKGLIPLRAGRLGFWMR